MPLSSRTSPAALRTIRDAFEDLRQIVSAGDRANWDSTTLDNVRHAIHLVEDQLAARQSLRNMRRLMPLFEGLGYYSKSIEVLCNGTPYLPWLWAPIKVILKVASDYVEAFETIIKAYSRIAEPLRRFKTLDQAYSRNPDVQQTLAVFYADILRFHKEAYQVVCRNGWRVLFLSWWGRFQRRFDSIIEDLKEHESVVDKTANAVNIYEAKRMRETVAAWRQEFLAKVSAEETEHTSAQYLAIVGLLKTDGSDQARIFESIADEALKYPGTCAWITQQAKMSSWMRCRQESSFLILHGHPGTGKSVLATQVATFLRSSGQSLVITHFCTYSDMASMEYDQILRSIFTQLIRSNNDLVAHAYQELVLKKKIPSPAVLDQLLRTIIPAASPLPSKVRYIHIIVDGLDQCSADTQGRVITLLERIVSTAFPSGSTVCKALVSSGLSQAIMRKRRNKTMLSLADEKESMNKAIRQYTTQRLRSLSHRLFQARITEDDIREMETLIATKADGMFLWARLVLDYLGTNLSFMFSREEVLNAAHSLPRELSEFYSRILTQLTSQLDERSIARLKLILGWIAFAKRPLRKSEFRSALAFSLGDPDTSELVPSYVFDGLSTLIEERRDSSFAFIHVSIKDFLQSPESTLVLNEKVANYDQGLATASCLLSGFRWIAPRAASAEPSRTSRIIRGLHAFHIYSTQFWVQYLLFIASTQDDIDIESPFFLQSQQLAEELLSRQRDTSTGSGASIASQISDRRLERLKPYPELHTIVAMILMERKQTYLENIGDEDDTTCTQRSSNAAHHLRSLLLHYQHTVRDLLSQRTFPGVTMQDLDRFKQNFRTTAFTCRLWSCPRFAVGFETEELRLQHEVSHGRILCDFPGCPNLPFSSFHSLRAHKSRCHLSPSTSDSRRRGIRRTPDQSRTPTQPPIASQNKDFVKNSSALQGQSVPAPPPGPDGKRPIQPPPPLPEWLETALNALSERYPDDLFGAKMHYCALNKETYENVPLPLPNHDSGAPPPANIRFAWLPRIRCYDCLSKLYNAGSDTTVTNFELHLKDMAHRRRVFARVSEGQLSRYQAMIQEEQQRQPQQQNQIQQQATPPVRYLSDFYKEPSTQQPIAPQSLSQQPLNQPINSQHRTYSQPDNFVLYSTEADADPSFSFPAASTTSGLSTEQSQPLLDQRPLKRRSWSQQLQHQQLISQPPWIPQPTGITQSTSQQSTNQPVQSLQSIQQNDNSILSQQPTLSPPALPTLPLSKLQEDSPGSPQSRSSTGGAIHPPAAEEIARVQQFPQINKVEQTPLAQQWHAQQQLQRRRQWQQLNQLSREREQLDQLQREWLERLEQLDREQLDERERERLNQLERERERELLQRDLQWKREWDQWCNN